MPPKIETFPGKVPKPDDIVVLSRPLLLAALKLVDRLTGTVQAKWAVGGEAGQIMMGVNVKADRVVINTTKKGCEEIWEEMKEYQTLAPALAERKLAREADVGGEMLPVYIKSQYAELTIDGAKVEIYGDEQIKVGGWDWGDPLDFVPTYTYVPGGKQMPLVPLTLHSELALGLGWIDAVGLIADAVFSKHEHISKGPGPH